MMNDLAAVEALPLGRVGDLFGPCLHAVAELEVDLLAFRAAAPGVERREGVILRAESVARCGALLLPLGFGGGACLFP